MPSVLKELIHGYPTVPAASPPQQQHVQPAPFQRSSYAPGPAGSWKKGAAPTLLPDKLQGVSAAVVRQHFMRSEMRFMSKHEEALYAAVFVKLMDLPPFCNARNIGPEVELAIKNITARLQQADLTINFQPSSFFATKNTSTVYQQMYERGSKATDGSGKLILSGGSNGMNPVGERDKADTRITFRQGVGTGSTSGIGRFMQTGGVNQLSDGNYEVANKHFNPRTRQNFAALNWRRSEKGGAPTYGESHFILDASLKPGAIYYIGDTFNARQSAESRATFGTIFSLILWADPEVVEALIRACYYKIEDKHYKNLLRGGDSKSLLEAHLFNPITFRGSVKEMVVARADCRAAQRQWNLAMDKSSLTEPAKEEEVLANANEFCQRNGIKLRIRDA